METRGKMSFLLGLVVCAFIIRNWLYEKEIGRICLLSTTVGLTLSTSSYRMEVGKSQVQHRPVRPVLAIFSKVLCVGLPAPSCAL